MNCKPGDFARYVGAWEPARGMIFHVLEEHPGFEGAWIVSPTPPERLTSAVWDASLRPLRDPGDDARDESLSWLPVPSREKEGA